MTQTENAVVSTKPRMLAKITVNKVCGEIDFERLMVEKQIDLMLVIGQVGSFEQRDSDYGPYLRFRGRFIAKNLQTNAQSASGVAILPSLAAESLAGIVSTLEQNVGAAVEFGFKIGVELDLKAATKYVYTCESMFDLAQDDTLTKLEKKASALLEASKVAVLADQSEPVPETVTLKVKEKAKA